MLSIIKKYGIQVLPSILIISAFYIFTRSDFDKESKIEIKRLRAENDSIRLVNDSILNEISLSLLYVLKVIELTTAIFEI